MTNNRFWAYAWIDQYGIDSVSTAKSVLVDAKSVDELREFALRARNETQQPDEFSLVAGRGIDLSGHLDCNASRCRTRQVDDLFRHAWHYFDRIVVADAMSHEVTKHWDAPLRDRRQWLLSHIEVLLHLRSLGAEELVIFREKPIPCEVHWEQHAGDVGLTGLLKQREHLTEILIREGKISVEEVKSGSLDFAFVHPNFEHTVWGTVDESELSTRDSKTVEKAVATSVLKRYIAHLTSDVGTTKELGIPLGSTIWLHGEMLNGSAIESSPSEVAFQLQLPILQRIPLDVLLKIRTDERDAFLRFRYKLRQAIRERSKAAGDSSAKTLAEEIRQDLIEPELEKIRQRLASAERMLQKKTSFGIALGGLVTACGLLSGVGAPLATTAGFGTLATVAGTAAAKDIEERRDVALTDMYFLWKALGHQMHNHDA